MKSFNVVKFYDLHHQLHIGRMFEIFLLIWEIGRMVMLIWNALFSGLKPNLFQKIRASWKFHCRRQSSAQHFRYSQRSTTVGRLIMDTTTLQGWRQMPPKERHFDWHYFRWGSHFEEHLHGIFALLVSNFSSLFVFILSQENWMKKLHFSEKIFFQAFAFLKLEVVEWVNHFENYVQKKHKK